MAQSSIITGQYVEITQTPASVGDRMLGALIDVAILMIYSTVATITLLYVGDSLTIYDVGMIIALVSPRSAVITHAVGRALVLGFGAGSILVPIALVLSLLVGGGALYFSDYYKADQVAEAAVTSSEEVEVRSIEGGDLALVPHDPVAGLVL